MFLIGLTILKVSSITLPMKGVTGKNDQPDYSTFVNPDYFPVILI